MSRRSDLDLDSDTTGDRSESSSDDSSSERPSVLAARETRQVWASKLAMLLVLVCAAGCVGYSTWKFTSDAERDDFESSVSR